MNEALTLADKIVIMDKGHIIQQDSPENILKYPATDYVRELLGEENAKPKHPTTLWKLL